MVAEATIYPSALGARMCQGTFFFYFIGKTAYGALLN